MKAIMYHYVRPDQKKPPYYYYLDLEDFRRQLDYFEQEYGFVDREQFFGALRGEYEDQPEGVVLTFDDGLIDHYKWVLPELRKRNHWGVFYVPTGPLANDEVLNVHRIHTLLGGYGGDQVLSELQPMVTEEMIPEGRAEEFRSETYTRQENAESTQLVKRVLNYYVRDTHRKKVIDDLVETLPEADIDVSDLYMSSDQLSELQGAGMIVGSHSVNHRVFSNITVDQQWAEITESFAYLSENLDGLDVKTFCYPYGGYHTFTDETRQFLHEVDTEFAFNVESTDLGLTDFRESPLALPRYDCNEFPHGGPSGTLG